MVDAATATPVEVYRDTQVNQGENVTGYGQRNEKQPDLALRKKYDGRKDHC